MAYAGNFVFNDEDDFCEGYDDTARCACCGKRYTPGYMDSEGDGDVPGGIHEFGVPPERDCDCTDKDLRLALEAKDEIIHLNDAGQRLLVWLSEFNGLQHIDEWDICRLSESTGKSFVRLIEYSADALILSHIHAWSKHMQQCVKEGRYG